MHAGALRAETLVHAGLAELTLELAALGSKVTLHAGALRAETLVHAGLAELTLELAALGSKVTLHAGALRATTLVLHAGLTMAAALVIHTGLAVAAALVLAHTGLLAELICIGAHKVTLGSESLCSTDLAVFISIILSQECSFGISRSNLGSRCYGSRSSLRSRTLCKHRQRSRE